MGRVWVGVRLDGLESWTTLLTRSSVILYYGMVWYTTPYHTIPYHAIPYPVLTHHTIFGVSAPRDRFTTETVCGGPCTSSGARAIWANTQDNLDRTEDRTTRTDAWVAGQDRTRSTGRQRTQTTEDNMGQRTRFQTTNCMMQSRYFENLCANTF